MSEIKIGDKVRVNFKALSYYHGKEGIVKAIMREGYTDGHTKHWRKEYSVQFKNPTEWAFFTKKELTKLEDSDG